MITIVTDTSAGYSRAELQSRNVRMVNLAYSISGISYDEQCRGENGRFLPMLRGKLCKTSQPSLETFREMFESLCAGGGEVLCVTISGALSGTYSSAVMASKAFGGRVRVVDSGTCNGGLHMLVDEAVNMTVAGLTLEAICTHLEEIKKKIYTVFTVEDLDPLRRGGRLVLGGAANTTLNMRPILSCESSIKFISNVRGTQARLKALFSELPDSVRRLFIMKVGEQTNTTDLELALAKRYPGIKIHLRVVGPVLSVHLGEGAYGIAYLKSDKINV